MVATVQKFPLWGLKNIKINPHYGFQRLFLIDATRGLAASRVPELHW